jgi:hypothetical protein
MTGLYFFSAWKGLTAAGQVPAFSAENPYTWIGRRPQSALYGIHLGRVPAKTAENPLTWTRLLPGGPEFREIHSKLSTILYVLDKIAKICPVQLK